MVGKLNDMVTAAVVVDSTPKVKPVEQQDFAQVRPVETQQQSALKSLDTQAAKEEEQKKQEGRLEPGTMSE